MGEEISFMMENKWKLMLCLTVGIMVFLIVGSHMLFLQESTVIEPGPVQSTSSPYHIHSFVSVKEVIKEGTKEEIIKAARLIHNANKHARGSKTSGYLKDALYVMKLILKDIDIDDKILFERPSVKSKSVCPESYKGGAFGFPLYYKGFEVDNCNYSVPISKLVTVIKYFDSKSTSDILETFVASINKSVSNIKTLIAIDSETVSINLKGKYPHVSFLAAKYKNEGFAINILVKQVKTPYILIARDMEFLTNDSKLERMVRELESLNVAAVGGAFRYPNGHWHKGCFQMMYRNYSLEFISGYDESFHECLFCDYMQGPFLTDTKNLISNAFGDFNENNGLYEDWFLRIFKKREETVVCPDSMFHIKSKDGVKSESLSGLLQKWDLYKILTPDGKTVTGNCQNIKHIQGRKSLALSPCALKSNNEAVKTVMQKCTEVGITCELQEGTALGAAKFGGSLPWELDYDLRFSMENCSKCKLLEQAFLKSKIKFATFSSDCCTKKLKLGDRINYKVTVNGYKGDFTGHPVMGSEELGEISIEPTKVLYDGQWVNFARNPGLYLRNRYGKEIFRHAEHWYHSAGLKGHGRMDYVTNTFTRCTSPGAHNCLDRYNGDGNLPFIYLLP